MEFGFLELPLGWEQHLLGTVLKYGCAHPEAPWSKEWRWARRES